jgi:hypothetical protein
MAKPKKQKQQKRTSSHISQTEAFYQEKVNMAKKPYEGPGFRPYPYDKLKKLIGDLRSSSKSRQVSASVEFTKNHEAISEALNNTPDFTETEVFKKVIDRIIKEQELFFKKLAKEKNERALLFLAESRAIPEKIRDRAGEILSKIDKEYAKERIVRKTKDEIRTRQIAESSPMEKNEIMILLKKLKSRRKEEKVSALAKLIDDFQSVMATANLDEEIDEEEIEGEIEIALEELGEELIMELGERRNSELLEFLGSFSLASEEVQEAAEFMTEQLETTPKEIVEEKPKKEKTRARVSMPKVNAKQYDAAAVKRLFTRLKSSRTTEALAAAIEFLSNYERILEGVMKTPMLSVTDITKKAVKVISKNKNKVMDTLERNKDKKALNFLSTSERIPEEISKMAKRVLERIQILKEGEEIAVEEAMEDEEVETETKSQAFGAPPPPDDGEGPEEEEQSDQKD